MEVQVPVRASVAAEDKSTRGSWGRGTVGVSMCVAGPGVTNRKGGRGFRMRGILAEAVNTLSFVVCIFNSLLRFSYIYMAGKGRRTVK